MSASASFHIVWYVKVVEGLSRGIEPGASVAVTELGLPVGGRRGLLLVFWKST